VLYVRRGVCCIWRVGVLCAYEEVFGVGVCNVGVLGMWICVHGVCVLCEWSVCVVL
jgi:hypothetical protein